jgi:deoxyadenosine/deoxycytidine kinase
MSYKIVSIEGNIGSGKSTLLENLRKYYSKNTNVIFLREPVDDWEKIKDKQGNTMLQKFYGDQEKYSFAFQMMAYISRLKILKETVDMIENEKKKYTKDEFERIIHSHEHNHEIKQYIIITERSLFTDKHVFAKMLYDQDKMEDVCYQIYLNWFDIFAKEYPVSYSVYVNANPEKCYERIHNRAREGEELIPLSYLQDCHKYHEEFLDNFINHKLILDGDVDIFKNEKIVEDWLEQIHLFLRG